MTDPGLLLGEFSRTLDDRYRLSIPLELLEPLLGRPPGTNDPSQATARCILAKERPGALSLWDAVLWQSKLTAGVDLIQGKMRAGKLEGRLEEVQTLGRLLSTRHREVPLAGRGRLVLPEGFREFLQVEPGSTVMVVGAGVCVELWNPRAWLTYLEGRMPEFQQLFDKLSS